LRELWDTCAHRMIVTFCLLWFNTMPNLKISLFHTGLLATRVMGDFRWVGTLDSSPNWCHGWRRFLRCPSVCRMQWGEAEPLWIRIYMARSTKAAKWGLLFMCPWSWKRVDSCWCQSVSPSLPLSLGSALVAWANTNQLWSSSVKEDP